MLIIAGTITVDPADRDRFLASRRPTVGKARARPGCIDYAFSADAVDPASVRLFERWERQEDVDGWLAAHRAEREASQEPDIPVVRMDFVRYQISGSGPLS